ncbi:MAG: hypothetical protein R3356_07410, partial [Eudoraea sp.]|nr:hypothetical protein [Eudoraea sp.]
TLIRKMCDEFNRNNYDAMIPYTDGYREPLHAIYSKELLKDLDRYLEESTDYAIIDFLSGFKVGSYSTGPGTQFTNINSPADYDHYNTM